MTQSLEEIADRIIICGVEELHHQLESHDISLVVSACSSEETNANIKIKPRDEGGSTITTSAQALIDQASIKGVEHHPSLLYQTYGDFLDQYTPYKMTEQEEQAYYCELAEETLGAIKGALEQDSNKKVIIHCVYGADRSAMVALAYFINVLSVNASIDEAIKILHKKRPSAGLEGVSQQFKSYLGEKFDEYRQAIIDYRAVLAINEKIPLSMRAKDFLMATGLTEKEHAQYKLTRERFGMSLPTLAA